MDITFSDDKFDRLEADPQFHGGYPPAVVKAFRKRMQQIRAAPDEREFYELRSLKFEKLKGKRRHQYSMRLNDQWRLIIELRGKDDQKNVMVCSIEDYH